MFTRNDCGYSPWETKITITVTADGSITIKFKPNRPNTAFERTYTGRVGADGSFTAEARGILQSTTSSGYTGTFTGTITGKNLTGQESVTPDVDS